VPTAADPGEVDMAGVPHRRPRLSQPALPRATQMVDCALEFSGLAEDVL